MTVDRSLLRYAAVIVFIVTAVLLLLSVVGVITGLALVAIGLALAHA